MIEPTAQSELLPVSPRLIAVKYIVRNRTLPHALLRMVFAYRAGPIGRSPANEDGCPADPRTGKGRRSV